MVTVVTGFDLPGCLKAVAAIEAEVRQLASALTEAQFHAPPRTGGWSVGYCLEHLVLTGQAFFPKWDTALKEAAAKRSYSDEAFPYAWWHRRILRLAEPPYKLKTKTTQSFLPCSRRPMEETVHRFLSMHREFASRVAGSSGLDVKRTKVQSPFVSWMWYPLGFSFDLALAHERRHLWQAWQVRQQLIDQA
jgi:DinB superfamily